MKKVNVGIIGCGAISGIYLKNLCTVFDAVKVTACADLIHARAQAKEAEFPGVRALSPEALLADPDIELVVNLTWPKAHYPVSMAAVQAGKHVYAEKPMTLTRQESRRLLAAAARRGVRVGNAPDTFLGAGLQTCRKLVDDGAIGDPVGATAFMLCHGHESWHPDPEFYYEVGGGPMFDMGPYYLTALVNLLGPVARVSGSTRITFPTRTITSEKKRGKKVAVEVPTHVCGVLDFASGAVATLVTSFDVWAHALPPLEVYGTEGSLGVPDPNTFGGPVRLKRAGDKEWRDVPLTHGHAENSRGLGVADMARALRAGRPHRAAGELAAHVVDVMHAIHDASARGRHVFPKTTCARPAALRAG